MVWQRPSAVLSMTERVEPKKKKFILILITYQNSTCVVRQGANEQLDVSYEDPWKSLKQNAEKFVDKNQFWVESLTQIITFRRFRAHHMTKALRKRDEIYLKASGFL